MGLIESIRLAFSSLSANKMRSLLTMLGIIIGISAVITITTIGNSIQQTLKNTFAQINMNYFYVILTTKPYDEENSDMTADEYDDSVYMTDEDMITDDMLNELLEKYPDQFKIAMSESYASGETINSKNEYIKTALTGVTDGYLEQGKIEIISGRNITQRDNTERKHTAVVSDVFVKQYFGENENPVGKRISFSVNNAEIQEFTIVGVYEYSEAKLGKFPAGSKEIDKVTPVFIPLDTVYEFKGILNPTYEYTVILWNTDYDASVAEENVRTFFEEQYQHNKYWTVYVENEQSMLSMINNVLNVITIAISVIAAISLVVGGVGVMNIMLVSIIERTKEIGIRKALGAQNSSIRLQFVVEAVIICLIGGIIGIITGILNGVIIGKIVSYLVNNIYTDYMDIIIISIQPSVTAIIISVIFSMLTGIFFGYYPANKASKMNPIDALRYD
mgnify:CR=1 FL=1